MNSNTWNRKLNKQHLEKTIQFDLKKPKKRLSPNCEHNYPDGMALFYLTSSFTSEEKIEMVKTCTRCGGQRDL